jgi:hypothetical protein
MFNLDQQIDHWKSAFAKKVVCSSDDLQELESHLREDIAALVAIGRSEQEAFSESVSRLGDPDEISEEFAKVEGRFLWDCVALRGNRAMVNVAGLAGALCGLAVWIKKGDGLLGAHVGSIIFAYVVPFLLAVVGTYAIFRAAFVKSGQAQFRDRLARHCRFLFGVTALGGATGAILGGIWAQHNWGRFWGWDSKEIGALSVVVCAIVLYLLIVKHNPRSVQLGQASLIMSLVTCVAWLWPLVYMEPVGQYVLALLIVCLMVQLSILSASVFLSKRGLAVR